MNRVILLGRLTRNPETRYGKGETPLAVTRYTLAVRKQFKRENEPDADFINCVAIGKRGEFAEKYFAKGRQVAVEGRLSIREYDDKDGKRAWFTEVVVDNQYFAESKGGGRQEPPDADYYAENYTENYAENGGYPAGKEELTEDDLPF